MVELVPVVAVARNGVIGKDGGLPWRLPPDLKRFKALTMGHPIVMGRRTWTSLGRPLPGRVNIVVTRDAKFHADGAVVAGSLEAAVGAAAERGAFAYVIGGAELYRQTMARVRRMHLTVIDRDFDGDTRLAPLDPDAWRVAHAEMASHEGLDYAFVDLERVREDRAPRETCWAEFLARARDARP